MNSRMQILFLSNHTVPMCKPSLFWYCLKRNIFHDRKLDPEPHWQTCYAKKFQQTKIGRASSFPFIFKNFNYFIESFKSYQKVSILNDVIQKIDTRKKREHKLCGKYEHFHSWCQFQLTHFFSVFRIIVVSVCDARKSSLHKIYF